MSLPRINPEIKEDLIAGEITKESGEQLFSQDESISVIVSLDHSLHLQMFEKNSLPDNLNKVIETLDSIASSSFLDQVNIHKDRPLVVHLNGKNIHFRTAAEIMCYVDGMQNMWEMVYDKLEDAANEEVW
jgi:hypothetical protein